MTCWRCGFTKGHRLVTGEDGRPVCKSPVACTKRLRERVGIRVVLEGHTPVADEADVAREIRNAYYRHGLCITCGTVKHSPGRPRCETCHTLHTGRRVVMA